MSESWEGLDGRTKALHECVCSMWSSRSMRLSDDPATDDTAGEPSSSPGKVKGAKTFGNNIQSILPTAKLQGLL